MRPIPIIIAVIVTTFLFFFVIQRDQLLNLASGPGDTPAEDVTEIATGLIPELRQREMQAEADRKVPAENIDLLRDSPTVLDGLPP